MFIISTGHPIITGDSEKDFKSLSLSFSSLLDELTYILPQLSGQVDAIAFPVTDNDENKQTE